VTLAMVKACGLAVTPESDENQTRGRDLSRRGRSRGNNAKHDGDRNGGCTPSVGVSVTARRNLRGESGWIHADGNRRGSEVGASVAPDGVAASQFPPE